MDTILAFSPWLLAAIYVAGIVTGIALVMAVNRLVPAPDMATSLTVHTHSPIDWPAIDPSGLGREFGPERVTSLQ